MNGVDLDSPRVQRALRIAALLGAPIGFAIMVVPSIAQSALSDFDLPVPPLEMVVIGATFVAAAITVIAAARSRPVPAGSVDDMDDRRRRAARFAVRMAVVGAAGALAAGLLRLVLGEAALASSLAGILLRAGAIAAAAGAATQAVMAMWGLELDALWVRGVRGFAVAAIAAIFLLVVCLALVALLPEDELRRYGYIFVGVAIFAVGLGGALASAIVASSARATMARRGRRGESIAESIRLECDCPRCGAARAAPTGVSACPRCRFAIFVEIEEPRCACGYSLFALRGTTCPECGRAIEPAAAPRATSAAGTAPT